MHPRHDDVAAFHVSHVGGGRLRADAVQHVLHPGPAGVDDRAGGDFLGRAGTCLQPRAPEIAVAARRHETRAHADPRAFRLRRQRIDEDETSVVDARVGVDEPLAKARLQPGAPAAVGQVHRKRLRQRHPTAQPVVQEKARADHPRRSQVRLVRQDERKRIDEVRREPEQDLALGQRFAHQPELVVLEIAEAAVDQLGAPRGGMRREVVALDQQHLEPASRGITGDACAVDAAAHDQEVECLLIAHRWPRVYRMRYDSRWTHVEHVP